MNTLATLSFRTNLMIPGASPLSFAFRVPRPHPVRLSQDYNIETVHLGFRPVLNADLSWCASILEDGFEQRAELRQQLPGIWRELLAENAIVMSVTEDHDCSNRLVAFGTTAFVSDRFVEDALAHPQPGLALRILDRERIRRNRVILRPNEIRRQSVGSGLNLVILHYSEVADNYSDDDRSIIRDTMVFGLLESHRRHNLKCLLYELYGEQDVSYVLDSGVNLVCDFQDWYRERNQPLPESSRRPFLFATNREDARKRRAHWMSWLFMSREARIGLSPAEQRIAARALAGETDAQLAQNPAVSPGAVRKHWRSIYKKFEAAGISLIPSEMAGSGNGRTLTGEAMHKKKRPFVLNYLRQHPEELRPQAAAVAAE